MYIIKTINLGFIEVIKSRLNKLEYMRKSDLVNELIFAMVTNKDLSHFFQLLDECYGIPTEKDCITFKDYILDMQSIIDYKLKQEGIYEVIDLTYDNKVIGKKKCE